MFVQKSDKIDEIWLCDENFADKNFVRRKFCPIMYFVIAPSCKSHKTKRVGNLIFIDQHP